MKIPIILGLLVLTFAPARVTATQPYPGDLIAVTTGLVGQKLGGAFHIDPVGKVRTIQSGRPTRVLSMDHDNRSLVIDGLFAVQPMTFGVVRTLMQPASTHVLSLAPAHTGEWIVVISDGRSPARLLRVRDDGSGATTVRTGSTHRSWHVARQDLITGGILEGEPAGLYRMPFGGGPRTPIWGGAVYSFAQDFTDGSIYMPTTNRLLRITPSGLVTTIQTGTTYNHVLVDRGSGRGDLVALGAFQVLRLDRAGNVLATHPMPYVTPRAAFLYGRNLTTRRFSSGANRWRFHLDFPGEGGRTYVLGLSASGFRSGLPVGTRTVHLNPDALLGLSVSGKLFPLFRNGTGSLDPSGAADAFLDLNAYGSSLRGVRVWAVGVTLDPRAPLGIATISKPVIVVLD